jgi:site-specific DNA-methyltransferase (adenine-specific)
VNERFNLFEGNCLEVMKTMEADSIDSIVTDPPYELGFMGKSWDSSGIAFNVEVWQEALRVLKPGGHLIAFSGSRTYHRMAVAIEDAGFVIRDQIMWVYGSGFPKSHNLKGDWQGWGTALKPAHEPMVLARKPLIGTVANNVLTFGTGGLNIDGGRVGRAEGDDSSAGNRTATFGTQDTASGGDGSGGWEQNTAGRFPANFIHDGSDEVNELLGEFARFFYCAKAGSKDRNEGLDGFEEIQITGGGGLTANLREDGSLETASAGGKYGSIKAKKANHHPTVKPTSLMQYLVRLVTPSNGIVLDPFLGSGSTGKAAMYEGFNFVGIELTPEYLPIAKARILFALKDKEGELDFEPR